jgi:putative hydrolase of the HAD superfamily
VFDLWETLADWPVDRTSELFDRLNAQLGGVDWAETYVERMTTPLESYYRSLGADPALAGELATARTAFTREILAPREGVVETLDALRRRGLALGLISVCSEDVCLVWDETDFAGHFDATVFSAACGLMKPDPRIYLRVCADLGVEPEECLYVGDGANDELAGARRVGMRPVLIHRAGENPDWDGPRITSIPDVLDLV